MSSYRARVIRFGASGFTWFTRGQGLSADMDLNDVDVATIRDKMNSLAKLQRLPRFARLEQVSIAGVDTELVHTRGESPDRLILWLHGGAHCLCSPLTHRPMAIAISKAAGCAVVVPDYRLAPEFPYPAARDDVLEVWDWLLEQGYHADQIALGGDSSGGGLAFTVAVALRDRGGPMPSAIVAASPWTDMSQSGDSYRTKADVDPLLPAELVGLPARAYAGDLPLDHPGVSPLFADLRGLPPTLIHVGSDEILLDDSRRMLENLRAAGVDASLGIFEGMWHVFQAVPGVPEGTRSLREMAAFARRNAESMEFTG